MKKSMIFVGMLAIGFANAQTEEELQGRVGINTPTPKASLDITRHTDIPASNPQGLLLPHLSKEQRDAFAQSKLTNGLMIYNTTKNCIDWWNGSQWACTDGTQADYPPVNTTLDTNIKAEIWDRTYYIASFNHNGFNADGTLGLGKRTGERFLILNIPYNEATVNKSYKDIYVERTVKDRHGVDKTLRLHIPGGMFLTDKGFLTAYIGVDDATIDDVYEVKQLPANTEEEITNFTFSINGRVSNVRLIATGGLLDRNWDIQTDGAYKHKFVYVPISVPTILETSIPTKGQPYERTWLSNNLGAEYADANNPRGNFNPTQQAITDNDHLAFGSLYQWQRPSDGHELVTWNSPTNAILTPITSTLSNNVDWTAGHSYFAPVSTFGEPWIDLTVIPDYVPYDLWKVRKANNPCPSGYYVPTGEDWNETKAALQAGGAPATDWPELWLSKNPYRGEGGKLSRNENGSWWTSTVHTTSKNSQYFKGDTQLTTSSLGAGAGRAVRCIKD